MIVLAVEVMALVGMAGAANYMYEKSSVKGVGYRSLEMVISTQTGYNGVKLVEKQSGSGNVISSHIEMEAERQPADLDVSLADWHHAHGLHQLHFAAGSGVYARLLPDRHLRPEVGRQALRTELQDRCCADGDVHPC